jgi:hypothetical protein
MLSHYARNDRRSSWPDPLVYQWIREHQEACQELQQMKTKFPNQYQDKQFPDNVRLIVHVKHGDNPDTQW